MPRFHTRRHKARGRKSRLSRHRRSIRRRQRGGDKKTVMKHLADFAKDQETGEVPGIYFSINEVNVESENNVLIIGPRYPKQSEESMVNCKYPYEECLFFFHMGFPAAYPSVSPVMKHLTSSLDPHNTRLHPNLYTRSVIDSSDGKVCLSILGTWAGPGWEPTMNIQSTLQTVQSILGPNAITNEPSFEALPDSDPRVVSYNHAAFAASVRISLSVYKMVLQAGSEEAVPNEIVKPFYDVLMERAYTGINFYMRKLAFLKSRYPSGYQTVAEVHHGAQKINYERLYDEAFTLLPLIPTGLDKFLNSEDSSVKSEEDARQAELESRRLARIEAMGMGSGAAPTREAWFLSLPKPLPAPNDGYWAGAANANNLNYIAANYEKKGNTNIAARFKAKAALKRKVAKVKYVDPVTEKPINTGSNNGNGNGNGYVYENDEENLEQPEEGEEI